MCKQFDSNDEKCQEFLSRIIAFLSNRWQLFVSLLCLESEDGKKRCFFAFRLENDELIWREKEFHLWKNFIESRRVSLEIWTRNPMSSKERFSPLVDIDIGRSSTCFNIGYYCNGSDLGFLWSCSWNDLSGILVFSCLHLDIFHNVFHQ